MNTLVSFLPRLTADHKAALKNKFTGVDEIVELPMPTIDEFYSEMDVDRCIKNMLSYDIPKTTCCIVIDNNIDISFVTRLMDKCDYPVYLETKYSTANGGIILGRFCK